MKGTMKKLLVSLLAFCLIMGNGVVMASSVQVSTTNNQDGSVNVDVDVTGDVENDTGGPGIAVGNVGIDTTGVIVSGKTESL